LGFPGAMSAAQPGALHAEPSGGGAAKRGRAQLSTGGASPRGVAEERGRHAPCGLGVFLCPLWGPDFLGQAAHSLSTAGGVFFFNNINILFGVSG